MGWEALANWGGDVEPIEQLTGGGANDVWSLHIEGRLAVGRLGTRSDAGLRWETDLMHYLDDHGLSVPVPIPTTDGRYFADDLIVMTDVEGAPPTTDAEVRPV